MLLQKTRYIFSILIVGSILFSNDIDRDCPENFVLNPQYPANGPECYPNEFLFYSSSFQAFYYFSEVTIDNITRPVQLMLKTNQFNLSTRRRAEKEVKKSTVASSDADTDEI